MVRRADKGLKFKRWQFCRPVHSEARSWKKTLQNVIGKGRVEIRFFEISRCRVGMEWPEAVTVSSAKRLVKLAKDDNPDFQLVGEPLGLEGEEDDSRALPSWCRPEPAAESVDQSSLDERLYQPRLDEPQPESRGLAPGLLLLKSASVSDAFKNAEAYVEHTPKYRVHRGRVLGRGTFGTVYAASAMGHSDEFFAIKLFDRVRQGKARASCSDAMSEVRRYVALLGHANIVQLLDIDIFRPIAEPPSIGFVFQRYDTDVRQFLKKRSFTRAGVRHVLGSLLHALVHMHGQNLVHADLKPANIFLKGRDPFRDGWLVQKKKSSSGAASAEGEPLAITHQLPAAFIVVPGDLGMSQMGSSQERNVRKLLPSDKVLSICTLLYRSPDLCLGNQHYGTELDMWSFGCVAAELFLRAPLVPNNLFAS